MNWFTADTHFGHKNVIDYCQRPFHSVDFMDSVLIHRWNELVKPEDTVYHLGDFSFHGAIKTADILSQLNGKKILVRGNHDHWKDQKFIRLGFTDVFDSLIDREFYLSHFPFKGYEADERTFERQLNDDGSWLLHGHVHNHWKIKNRMINVGVDVWNFYPVSEKQILEIIEHQSEPREKKESDKEKKQ